MHPPNAIGGGCNPPPGYASSFIVAFPLIKHHKNSIIDDPSATARKFTLKQGCVQTFSMEGTNTTQRVCVWINQVQIYGSRL